MKFNFVKVLTISLITTVLVVSCKKEDDTINDNTNPNELEDNVETIFGCMVDTACNYNSRNADNESCDYSCYACTDELALITIQKQQLMMEVVYTPSDYDKYLVS